MEKAKLKNVATQRRMFKEGGIHIVPEEKIKMKTEVSTEFGNTEITGLPEKNNFGRLEN